MNLMKKMKKEGTEVFFWKKHNPILCYFKKHTTAFVSFEKKINVYSINCQLWSLWTNWIIINITFMHQNVSSQRKWW